ncbi:hypothetical protein RhiXN_03290 [Rhizoctonia solani]|uniref:Uncharacterized protein n=1 Tax=Rhizoctonia solani TaxID=456999 RepID=A0A8H7H679_9AGAM|nr:uncharacterized protein RhiXN_03290 [Rhizoctonia solani]KAF8676984.1 hypothetical protein RHS04_06397 [Rhizoctonia solani]QRW18366.1 hypothetical protein RhiXN_03290 [Rhizoctonia solani]
MSAIAKKAGLKLFERHLENYSPSDPLYEEYTDENGKKKRRKRELPPGLSKRDAAILKKVKKRAHYLDKGFSVCGLRFGWTFVIGIIPGAGDAANVALNYLLVVRKSRQAEIPGWLLRKMLANNAVSAGVGLVPVAGDVVVAAFKTNSRNAALLEEFLRIRQVPFILNFQLAVHLPLLCRGEEFLKGEAARQEDPAVVKPGAGREQGEAIPGKNASTMKSLFSGKPKKGNPSTALTNQEGPRR